MKPARWAPEGTDFAAIRAENRAFNDQMRSLPPAGPNAPKLGNATLPVPRLPRAEPLERTVQRAIVKACEARGWAVERRSSAVTEIEGRTLRTGTPGEADLEVLPGNGLAVFLEVKRPGGKPSDRQMHWLERRRARGYVAEVVDNVADAIKAVESAIGRRA